jgi:hypothetical protein
LADRYFKKIKNMKQINIKKGLLAATMMGSVLMANAQSSHPLSFGSINGFAPNYYANYIGVRLSVTAPASIIGDKQYTTANDGTNNANNWAVPVTSPIINADVVMAEPDSSANATITNSMSQSIGLVYRGVNEFSEKAYAAQQAGAIACVIVNDVAGAPVGMAGDNDASLVTIPVFMISKADGDAIREQIEAGQTVTMSITTWGQGDQMDLGIVPGGLSLAHAYAIPTYELSSNNGNPVPLKNMDGAYVANFGLQPAADVKLTTTVQFTPTGGENSSTIMVDSSTVASFPATDSIIVMQTNSEYDLHPSGNGRYDFIYNLSSDFTDQYPTDNTATYSLYTTDNLYSKGRYDFTNNVPLINEYEASGAGTEFTWGPLYYISTGGHAMQNLQFSLASNTAGPLGGNQYLTVYIFKWTDGLVSLDSAIEGGELNLVGLAQLTVDGTDTSSEIFTIPVTDSTGTPGTQAVLDSNTWYWLAADVPAGLFLGVDGVTDYYPRTYVRQQGTGYFEMYAPLNGDIPQNLGSGQADANDLIDPFPFGGSTVTDSIVYSTQRGGLVPAIPFTTTLFNAGVKNVSKPWADVQVYPNPAVDNFNVSVGLDQPAKTVTYTIIDNLANVVTRETHNNVQNDNVSFSTANMAAGTYYVTVAADGKVMAKKVTVAK